MLRVLFQRHLVLLSSDFKRCCKSKISLEMLFIAKRLCLQQVILIKLSDVKKILFLWLKSKKRLFIFQLWLLFINVNCCFIRQRKDF